MKKYFIQLYGNCDFQRCWSDLKLVLTFETPAGFQISAGNIATLGSLRCFVPWPLIVGWAGGVKARDVDVGISQPHPNENRESQWVIEDYCIAMLGTEVEGKFFLFTEGKFFSVYSSQRLVLVVCVVCYLL